MNGLRIPTVHASIPFPSSGDVPNLLHLRPVSRLLRSRLYPGVFQFVAILVFGFIIYETLFGSRGRIWFC